MKKNEPKFKIGDVVRINANNPRVFTVTSIRDVNGPSHGGRFTYSPFPENEVDDNWYCYEDSLTLLTPLEKAML